jgi:hypothetical protein
MIIDQRKDVYMSLGHFTINSYIPWSNCLLSLMGLPYDPAVPPLGVSTKESKSAHIRSTCIPLPMAELVTVAKPWKEAA